MSHLLIERTGPGMGWLWTTTWQSAVLIGIILLVQRGLGRWLAPRWRHALWLLVMARLVWPCYPESRWSLFNLAGVTRESRAAAPMPDGGREPAWRTPGPGPGRAYDPPTGAAETKEKAPSAIEGRDAIASPIQVLRVREVGLGLLAVWLAGMVVFTVHLGLSLRRLRRALRERVAVVDPGVRRVLEECQERLGVRGRVGLQETGAVKSPALCGLWRPCLLLPPGLTRRFSPAELRLVFLHELAHLRRGDIALNWAATLLQIAHWFNPLVWLAFRRMRADRELACDALVLSVTPEAEHPTYGETIIKLLEAFSQAPARAALVGIMEDKTQMKRRIRMIANYRKAGGWSVCAGLLLPLLGALTFTQARTDRAGEPANLPTGFTQAQPGVGVSPTNIMTVRIRQDPPYFLLATNAFTAAELRAELAKRASQDPKLLLSIITETGVPFRPVIDVLDMAKEAAIPSTILSEAKLLTRPGTSGTAASAGTGQVPSNGPVKGPNSASARYFVRLVTDLDGLTFEGETIVWQDLPELLAKVPNRPHTVLELAVGTDEITLRQMNEAESRCQVLTAQHGFEFLSFIGVHPAGSQGSPPQEVIRPGIPTAAGSAETGRRPRFIYVTGEVLKPGSIPMLDDTQYTVFDAIGQAGGLTKAAKKNKLKLIRQGRAQYLDLQALENIKDPNDIIYLEPGDSLDVPPSVW